ncbi:MAG: MgtC/SapB family protein [Myxococcales bacterium]
MESYEPFVSLGVALAAGLLIGMERQQSANEDDPGNFLGGARTHPLVALVGACSMLLARQLGVVALAIGLLAVGAFVVVSYVDDVKKGRDRGLTSEVAFLLSFSLGALALSQGVIEPVQQKLIAVASIAVVATLLLSIKLSLHSVLAKASKEDVFATLKFLLVAVVALPLLPDRTFGPLDVLNPRNLGLMVVLIAGISFVGYLAIRILGARRGLGLTGLVGGLVSSTAVTLSFSGRAKEEPRLNASFALAVVLASSVMFLRVLLEVAVVNQELLPRLAIPMGAMAVGGALSSALLYRRSRKVEASLPEIQFSNPFELSSALKFAALFGVILLVSKAATTYFGAGATYLTGLLAGTTDVDAITLSMARLAKGTISAEVAVTTILIAVASNSVVKATMATVVGGWAFGRIIALAYLVSVALGGLGLALLWSGVI